MPKLTNDEIKSLATAVTIKAGPNDDISVVAEQVYALYERALDAIKAIDQEKNPPTPGVFFMDSPKR